MFPQYLGVVEIYSKYVTWDRYEIMPNDLNTRQARVVTGIISMRQIN